MCPSMTAGVAISTRALCGRCSRASAGIRSTTRGQYCAFWNIIGACDDAIPIPSMVSLLAGFAIRHEARATRIYRLGPNGTTTVCIRRIESIGGDLSRRNPRR